MTSKSKDHETRKWLLWILDGGGAHLSFDKAVRGLPPRRLEYHLLRLARGALLAFHDSVLPGR